MKNKKRISKYLQQDERQMSNEILSVTTTTTKTMIVKERYKRKLSCHQLYMLELNEGKMNN